MINSFYDVPEMASRLGVKEFTVCLWCRTGRLPADWHKPTSRYGKWLVAVNDFEVIVASLTDAAVV